MNIPMTVRSTQVRAPVTVQATKQDVVMNLSTECVMARPYSGTVEVTPSAEAQILPTKGYMLESNVVINPIPSNYGLITWDGSRLTVS